MTRNIVFVVSIALFAVSAAGQIVNVDLGTAGRASSFLITGAGATAAPAMHKHQHHRHRRFDRNFYHRWRYCRLGFLVRRGNV